MRPLFALLLLALFPANAQIMELSSDFTGANLVFWTRFQLQSEAGSDVEQKVYRWNDGQWSRVGRFDPPENFWNPQYLTRPFILTGAAISGWNVTGAPLGHFPFFQSEGYVVLTGLNLPKDFKTEYFRISSNGRYVVGGSNGTIYHLRQWTSEFLDTQTGARRRLPLESDLPAVADDGTLAYLQTGRQVGIKVLAPGHRQELFPITGTVEEIALSPNGQWVGVQVLQGDRRSLQVFSSSTGDSFDAGPVQSSSNWVSWKLSNTRAVLIPPDTTQLLSIDLAARQTSVLAESAEGFFTSTVSGDGNVAFASTNANRLTRFDLLSGSRQELLPPLGALIFAYGNNEIAGLNARGSASLLRGLFTKDQQASTNGQPLPVSMFTDEGLWFQTPWDYNGPPDSVVVVKAPGNPFESLYIKFNGNTDYAPDFPFRKVDGRTYPWVVHEDFKPVTDDQPAHPGERLHIYMTGLGPLQSSVPTGAPGPQSGVRPVRPLSCATTTVPSTNVPVRSVVYAPNLIGFYQVDITVPAGVPDGTWQILCGDPSGYPGAVGLIRTRP